MTMNKTVNGEELVVAVEGRLDTNTSVQFEQELRESLGGITRLVLDLSELVYVSSAGLRVILSAQKIMQRQGEMIVKNVNDDIMEIFEVTGFADVLTIE